MHRLVAGGEGVTVPVEEEQVPCVRLECPCQNQCARGGGVRRFPQESDCLGARPRGARGSDRVARTLLRSVRAIPNANGFSESRLRNSATASRE
ncbi:hypothetical protein Misp05_44760 [Micromonospora sp. NBRC 107095]|nr:hypothetical protein Misp05_44760 [Micromonospora sp. NBRC 107095]